MTANSAEKLPALPAFCEGIQHFAERWPEFQRFADSAG